MLLMLASKGRTPCGSSCPYYDSSGIVDCIGGQKQTNCRLLMQPHWLDCNIYDVRTLRTVEVSEEQWAQMQQAANIKPRKVRKPWRREHKVIHPLGTNTRAKKQIIHE